MKQKVAVIGGGISGITTAITLQLRGYETTCYTKQIVGDKVVDNPSFASQYPAASVIPHSVNSDELNQLFPASQSVFGQLHALRNFHVTKHRHYELFEFPEEPPSYSDSYLKYATVQNGPEGPVPQRKNAEALHGWSFDCYMAEWPNYIHNLYDYYRQAGGQIQQQEIQRKDIAGLPAEIIINCAGLGALKLANDHASPQLIRGHLVHIHDRPLVRDKNGQIVSYNYTPGRSVYSNGGEAGDIYFYPVDGRWIFGGSRQYGTIDEAGNWQGDEYEDEITIDGTGVPRPVITLNSEILEHSFGVSPKISASEVRAYTAYRFVRKDAEPSLRIEPDELGDKLLIHNYGHGGAGVTLSWGCALKILSYIEQSGVKGLPNQSREEMDSLKAGLSDVYSEYFEE